ncbi:MAG: hypothetical protein C0594_03880 [Marinilabiliales bacterium]|nr:MAG: hypothetical protein C0594_03880 [Marinilabiliales bacterium]
MKTIVIYLAAVLILVACGSEKSFEKHKSGLEYRIEYKSMSGIKPKDSDILVLDMKYYNSEDSLLFSTDEVSHEYKMQMKKPSHGGGCIEDAFALMEKGDSLVARIDAYQFFTQTRKMQPPAFIKDNEKLTFCIKLLDILNLDELKKDITGVSVNSQKEEDEMLENYLNMTNTTVDPTNSGLYYVELEKGTGPKPIAGDVVSVHYFGSFISGKPFSETYSSGQPFRFRLGNGDVITGWEEGVSYMKEGGKARFIIPSHLAYGKEGKGMKIPPYSTLVFEVELVKVEKAR